MKKIQVVLLLLIITILSGCSYTDDESSSKTETNITVYFRDVSEVDSDTSKEQVQSSIAEVIQSHLNQSTPIITTTIVTKATTETTTTQTQQISFTDLFKKTYTAKQNIILYSSPNLSSPIMRYINKNEELNVYGISSNNQWYSINYKSWKGYVLIDETTDEKPAIITTTITTTKASTLSTQSSQIQTTGYRLPYILSDEEWWWVCKVVCSETGYCGERQQKAVANTIFNRLIWAAQYGNYNPFPKDAISIIKQPSQYDAYKYWRSDTRLQPGGSLWNQTMKYIKEAASEPDFTNGAIGYYNPAMSGYLSAFENNRALLLAYTDGTGRFFKLNPACYTRK